MFFLCLIIFIICSLVIFSTLKIKLEFEDISINIPKKENKYFNNNSKVRLKFYILGKLKIADIDLKKIRIEKNKYKNLKKILKKFKYNEKNKISFKLKDIIGKIDFKIEKINLKINVGVEDAALTGLIAGTLYSVLECLIIKRIKNIGNQECIIIPNYNENILSIKLDSIFGVSMWNIINIFLNFERLYLKRRE